MRIKMLKSAQLLCRTALALLLPLPLLAACMDNVVLVHGNAGAPSDSPQSPSPAPAKSMSSGNPWA